MPRRRRQKVEKSNGLVRVAIYVRVSSEEQVREHYSLDTQIAACLEKLDKEIGPNLYVWEVFRDEGCPGRWGLYDPNNPRKKYRPALTAMYEAFKAGKFDVICVYRLNRLWRKAALADFLMEHFVRYGLKRLISCFENVDLDTASGRFYLNLSAAMGAYEAEQLGEWVSDSKRQRKREGYPNGVPFGWRWQREDEITGRRKGITVVPEQAEIVRQLAERYVCGESLRSLVKWINSLGIPTPRGARCWQPRTVQRLLANPVHAGLVAIEDENGQIRYIRGQHYEERIYDEEVFYQILERLKRNKRREGVQIAHPVYLLGGLIRCGHCGARLRGRFVQRLSARVYRCSDGSWLSNPDCTRNQERADFVENLIVRELRKIARDPEIQQKAKQKIEELVDQEQQSIEAEIATLEKRLGQLWDYYMFWADKHKEGKCDEAEFRRHVERFREERQVAETRLEDLKQRRATAEQRMAVLQRAREIIADFEAAWDGLSMEERRELIQSVIESCAMWRMPDGRTKVEFVVRGYEPVTRYIERQSRAARPTTGPEALTPTQQACLYLYCHEGLDRAQIAKRRGTGWGNINSLLWAARKKLGADTLEEAWGIAGEYILQNLHSLPLNGRVKPRRPKARELLTQAQRELLRLVRKGKSPQQIAKALGISINTVYVQLRNCRERLAVGTTEEAVRKAVGLGLVK